MYEIAEKIGYKKTTTKTIDNIAKLLDITDGKTNVWTAVHILERVPVDKKIEEKVLKIIKLKANGNSADAIGFKIWLENYKKMN